MGATSHEHTKGDTMEQLTADDYQKMLNLYAQENMRLGLMVKEYQVRLDKHEAPTAPVEGDVVEDPTAAE